MSDREDGRRHNCIGFVNRHTRNRTQAPIQLIPVLSQNSAVYSYLLSLKAFDRRSRRSRFEHLRSVSHVLPTSLKAQNYQDSGIFHAMTHYLQFVVLLAAGWISRDQQKIIDYLIEEIRVYQEHFEGRRLRFTDGQRRRLGVKAKALGRRMLKQFAGIVTPDTHLRWFRKLVARKYDGSAKRDPWRPRIRDGIADLAIQMAQRITPGDIPGSGMPYRILGSRCIGTPLSVSLSGAGLDAGKQWNFCGVCRWARHLSRTCAIICQSCVFFQFSRRSSLSNFFGAQYVWFCTGSDRVCSDDMLLRY